MKVLKITKRTLLRPRHAAPAEYATHYAERSHLCTAQNEGTVCNRCNILRRCTKRAFLVNVKDSNDPAFLELSERDWNRIETAAAGRPLDSLIWDLDRPVRYEPITVVFHASDKPSGQPQPDELWPTIGMLFGIYAPNARNLRDLTADVIRRRTALSA